MPSSYSTNLKIELQATGENSGTWGTITNTNLGTALEQAIVGYGNPSYASDANLTLTYTDTNAAQAARALVLNVTSAVSLTNTRELVVPTIQKQYIVQNNTTGSQSITVKTSAGTGITVPNGRKAHLYVDGTNVIYMDDYVDINGGAIDGTPIGANSASTGAFTTLSASGNITVSGGTANGVLYLNGSKVATSGSAVTYDGTTFGTTGAANFATSSGDVGIGTSSPVIGFTVQKDNGSGYIAAFRSAAGSPYITLQTTSGITQIQGINSAFTATNDIAMQLSGGNLGIGTSSPTNRLTVTPASNDVEALRVNALGGGGSVQGKVDLGFGFYDGVAQASAAVGFEEDGVASTGGILVFKTRPTGSAESTRPTTRMTLDASGNLGLGVTPSAWRSQERAIQIASGAAQYAQVVSAGAGIAFGSNYYRDSGGFKYTITGEAAGRFDYNYTGGGIFAWNIAPSGTAGNAITFTQAMTLDADGDLAIGSTTTTKVAGYRFLRVDGSTGGLIELTTGGTRVLQLQSNGTTNGGVIQTISSSPLILGTNSAERARITSGGDFGIGTTSPQAYTNYTVLTVDNATNGGVVSVRRNGNALLNLYTAAGEGRVEAANSAFLSFYTTSAERARITSAGYFRASNDGTYFNSTGAYHELRNSAADNIVTITNTSAVNPNGMAIVFTAASPNDANNHFIYCQDNAGGGTQRATIRSNGGLANYSANNVNLASDERLKKDISPLASAWNKVKGMEVVNFRYKDCNEGDPLLYGVIAQQVQPVVPELVVVTREATETDPEYYGIREQPMYWLAIKALQEAMTKIETLEAKVAALEAK